MRSRLTSFSLAFLVIASPVFARVISYAPYTNREARTGIHARDTRHFVLLEERSASFGDAEVVIYDSTGAEEPRVVFPSQTSGPNQITAVAMYETASTIYLAVFVASPRHTVFFSNDSGATWKEVTALRDKPVSYDEFTIDTGGPWVGGLGQPIRTGDAANPFYFGFYNAGIWTLDASGNAKQLDTRGNAYLAGQDRAGQRFLYTTFVQAENRTLREIRMLDRNGNSHAMALVTPMTNVTGWITDNGEAYLVLTRPEGRFLFHWRTNGDMRFVNGPEDAPPPPLTVDTANFSHRGFIAVPTGDFNGAWMIQRAQGRPTMLFRHNAAGLEKMWTDVSGPEVEALIAGKSGQTVLVQVHRDRTMELQRPFIDPALAVWRVGEGAPRTYDELYLNEEENKGFVHVDVDTMAAGSPFVFNSGSMQMSLEGPISPPVGGGGDVIQEWGVVRASLKQHLVLPGVARLRGAFDSHWLTDVTVYNPLDTQQNVTVQFVALGQTMEGGKRETQITLAAQEIRYIPDALKTLFNLEDGGGTLHFIPAEGINVTSRTYSRKGNGTYGFGMQAIDLFNAAGPRFPMTFAGAFPGDHFRTNVLLTDTSGRGADARINAYGVSGPMGQSTATISAPAGGTLQMNAVSQPIGLLAREYGGLVVQPTRGLGIPTVVAIDNRTNDPTYFPPDIPATIPRTIPVIGHVDGVNDSRFRSDLYLFNPTAQTRTIVLEATNWSSRTSRQTQFTLLPHEARVIADALPTLFQMTGLARLRFVSNELGEGVRATSRTYTIEANGATYGCLIPPLNNFQIGTPGDTLEILGASGGAGFRTNIGLVELSPMRNFAPTRVRIRLIDNTGKQLDTFTVEVPNAGGMQINDIFAARGITPPTASLIKIDVLDTGLIGAYATLTDNITNDSTYLGAQLGAQPN
jgi:hypothetical protein